MPVLQEGSATTTPQEIINAVQAMLEEAAATLEQQPATTSASSSSSVGTSPTPTRRSQGVTAGNYTLHVLYDTRNELESNNPTRSSFSILVGEFPNVLSCSIMALALHLLCRFG